ncbi:hypothetical protein SEPCBS119000_002348 [Sporothrix epigloea]|uniref:Uncharacterized protein n=1 Tax=Sporothrix epigloea TaxID=1892477 RepID=A0ABP0DFQ2_9PEZI
MVNGSDDLADGAVAMEVPAGLGPPGGSGKPQVDKAINKSSRPFWNQLTQPSTGSLARGRMATTPPPQPQYRSCSTHSMPDDVSVNSPIAAGEPYQPGRVPTSSSESADGSQPIQHPPLPGAADIMRRINNKRRRDDDLDPASFKRRAVSPGMSVHNSPVMQSPLRRDTLSWGGPGAGTPSTASRPGSVSGGIGSIGLFEVRSNSAESSSTTSNNNVNGSNNKRVAQTTMSRVGFQAMADTNDSITRLRIE